MKKLSKVLLTLMFLLPSLSMMAETFKGTRSDFRDETIYFAMTTRFYDGDPKNNVLSWDKQDVQKANNDPDWRGDFAGLIEKLDYIKALGFTAIWITPVTQNASGEDYHGYHSMDFSSVDLRYESRKEWGSAKDVKFQDLIDAAHAKGMKIVLDIVLNHTGNFGEVNLNPLFTRNQNIRNQATPAGSLIPNPERFAPNYFEQDGNKQYQERFKYFKNPQYDTHNIYHHYGTGWNWDLPNRWWGQIAGDCVDLNTENDAVAEYLVKCYGEFIKMGVDAFRIDTTGHISRLTFNTQFIPKFLEIAEQYKSKRLNGCPFFMFGECCARFGGVIYRDQHNLSSHFYTWKSDQSLMNTFKSHSSQAWWDTQKLNEGHDSPVGPMIDCESEKTFNKNSNNVFMQNGAWHEPDYSQYSGFSVIDFPMHYNFNNAGSAVNIAKEGDKYYNDASYNVVYVDSHDYCPGPNDGTRFNGGTGQWAENLSLMFTFRGIPCIYYGSEVEFKKGLPIDVGGENNKTPRSQSGRAYFGEYLEGSVSASDFGVYTANGNVSQTLNGDLAHHIRMLNKIRAAVPALRKGQYTFDGCSPDGGWAFKRAYKNESYALVAINGGATFSSVPAGTYTDVVTGDKYTASNGSITVSAPKNQGQLRVLVKDWNGGRVAEDGKFMYKSSSVSKGGNPTFADKGTTSYYTADDVVGNPSVKLSPAGGSFKTETLNITAELNEVATSGWYKIGTGSQVALTPGKTASFTIGSNMSFGETVTISWSATDGKETYTGSATYKKVDPNAVITVYVKGDKDAYMYAWDDKENKILGAWPGTKFSELEKVELGGEPFYCYSFDVDAINIIFNKDGQQTGNIEGIDADAYFEYNGGTSYKKIDEAPVANPKVSISPNGGSFKETIDVTATLNSVSTSGWYKIGDNGNQVNLTPDKATKFTLGNNMNPGDKVTVYWSATDGNKTNTGKATFTKVEPSAGITIYVKAKSAPHLHAWTSDGDLNGGWPGIQMKEKETVDGVEYWKHTFDADVNSVNIILHNNNGAQTEDIKGITSDEYFTYDGGSGFTRGKDSGNNGDNNQGGGDSGNTGDGFVIYFDNTDSNWATPYIHYWGASESNWPGVAMTKVTGNIWSYTVPAGTTGCIFNAGDGDASKTPDFEAKANHVYTTSGDQGVYDKDGNQGGNQGGDGSGNTGDGFVIYFDNTDSNWTTPYIHYWGASESSWPGVAMTKVSDNIWSYTVPAGTTGCIFNAGDGDATKTPDFVAQANHIYTTSGDQGLYKPSGVEDLKAEVEKVSVWAGQGKIYIEAPMDMDIMIVRLDGRYHIEPVKAGVNVIEGLPHGLYIVQGVKVIL
ncbi:MAG: starch-binding protein [Muribaculaceae bacterium]|nr:starch-binding protein [Muribaculaceae bacterium]